MGSIMHIVVPIACFICGCLAVAAVNHYAPQTTQRIVRWAASASARLSMMFRHCLPAIGKAFGLTAATLRSAIGGISKQAGQLHRKPPAPAPVPELNKPIDMAALNCRARIGREVYDGAWRSVLFVDICGTIEAPDDNCEVHLDIALSDAAESQPAMVRSQKGIAQEGRPFTCQTEMGKLCRRTTVLDEWTTVARVCPDLFVLPRQGQRNLQFNVGVLSTATKQRLATGTCILPYDNAETGYLDIEDRIQRAKTLAVGLAFSVGAADNNLLDSEIDVIHAWVKTNFDSSHASDSACSQLQRALHKTATFFRHGGRLDVERICHEIVEIAPLIGRLDMLDLCLRVAAARGQVSEAQTTLLKKLADALGIERARLRAMAEKILPISMHDVQDNEIVLGVTTDMTKDEARQQLNHEYAKWSSRVISSDPAIQKQADQMLQLIADARGQFVGINPTK
jgi:uncharacterized tellurite resistance protein B-like protein